jgi:hypothetical protein
MSLVVVRVAIVNSIIAMGPLFSISIYLFIFLVVYILHVFGHLVAADAGCNWYLRDINIFSLSER